MDALESRPLTFENHTIIMKTLTRDKPSQFFFLSLYVLSKENILTAWPSLSVPSTWSIHKRDEHLCESPAMGDSQVLRSFAFGEIQAPEVLEQMPFRRGPSRRAPFRRACFRRT